MLKQARNTLMKLQGSLGMDISRLEKLLIYPSRHHGLNGLSDDVLEKVIIAAVEETPLRKSRSHSLQNLSLVSKRFHGIIDNSRVAWANVNSMDGSRIIRHKLSKSKGAGLAITLNTKDLEDAELLAAIRDAGDRIIGCTYIHIHESSYSSSPLKTLWEEDVFDAVHTLVLSGFNRIPECWQFPRLKCLSLRGAGLPEHLLSSVTNLTLGLPGVTPRRLLRCLSEMPYLVELVLREVPYNTDLIPFPVSLPKLTSLTLRARGDKEFDDGRLMNIVQFSRYIRAPSLRSFEVELRTALLQGFILEGQVHFFPPDVPMDSVRELSFSLMGKSYDDWKGPVDDRIGSQMNEFIRSYLSRFPNVDKLTLHATKHTEKLACFESIFKLRELHVYGYYEVLSLRSKLVNALSSAEYRSSLREAFFHIRHDLKDETYEGMYSLKRVKAERGDRRLTIASVAEEMVGRTLISTVESRL